jgi:hypothetical protein
MGKLAWVRDTGSRARLIDSVELRLLPARERWQDPVEPLDDDLRMTLLEWAWSHPELRSSVLQAFRPPADTDAEALKNQFFEVARLWLTGAPFVQIAREAQLEMDDLLTVYTTAVAYALQTLIEQGISLLTRSLHARGIEVAPGVTGFTEQLRFGAPNLAACTLASGGVRHRKAYVALGALIAERGLGSDLATSKAVALDSLRQNAEQWRESLGELIYANALADLSRP